LVTESREKGIAFCAFTDGAGRQNARLQTCRTKANQVLLGNAGTQSSQTQLWFIGCQFLKRGIATAEEWDKVSCPLGLEIREDVQEIGVSNMAQ
jgi:hypothetical protein